MEAFRRPKVQIDGDVWRYILNENGYVDRVEEVAPGIYLYYDGMRLTAVSVFGYQEQPGWALARLPWSIRKVLEKSLRR
ncbi:MAG: hypothetical protein NZ482_01960 [Gloeomargarita sp. SKYG98]|nr:hypothetical protein [Gloeomargarita sp. SKYG98]